jgi:phenylalanyl-tRNA synthetase beta chain
MLVSLEWLREITTIKNTDEEIIENIPLNGLEIESVNKTGIGKQNVVVGEILDKKEHPENKKLYVTEVDCGKFGKKQIITDLACVNVGDKLLTALEGVVLADSKTVKAAEFKGVKSEGFFVSWELIGFSFKSPDPIYIEKSIENGSLYDEILPFNDTLIDVELTANRGDCLGMKGIATDIKARFDADLIPFNYNYQQIETKVEDEIEVDIQTEDCFRYCGAVIKNVKIAPSPMWMQLRLVKAGIRPINNIVDITNYILYEMNQPLHAFDYDKLASVNGKKKIIVRNANENEKLTTLDGIERELVVSDIVIADSNCGQCLGGVMGGENSEVTDNTVNVFLESAFFRPVNIRKTSRRLGLRSEASYRYEREIDRKNVDMALKRALYYFDMLNVGEISSGIIDVYPQKYEDKVIPTSATWINGKLGTDLSAVEIKNILEKLLFKVDIKEDELNITVPSARNDVLIKEDIAEEVARIYGYNKITPTYYPSKSAGVRTEEQKNVRKLHSIMVNCGLSEIKNFSFIGKSLFDKMLLPEDHYFRKAVMLEVPLTEDWAGMRNSLIPGIIRTIAFNVTRQNKNLSLFEIGNISIPSDELLPYEYRYAGIALAGNKFDKSFCQEAVKYDFYDLKGCFDNIFEQFNVEVSYKPIDECFFQPYQQAEIILNDKRVGILGKLHPEIANKFDIDVDTFIGELDTSILFTALTENIVFKEVPKFPSSERDIAVVIKDDILIDSVFSAIKELNLPLLQSVKIFDIYKGDKIEKDKYSVAIKLLFNKVTSTLKDSEIDEATNKILEVLGTKLGAVLR